LSKNYSILVSLFKQRKNKTFNLSSYTSDDTKANDSRDFSKRWLEARVTNTKRKKRIPLGILFVVLMLLIVAMYYIEKTYL